MPKLTTISSGESDVNTTDSVLVYGPPKAGKTQLVAEALAGSYNLIWFDLEKGWSTLLKLPEEKQECIDLYRILDNKDNPNAIKTMMKLLTGGKRNVCHAHGTVDCMPCKREKKATSDIELNKLDPKKDIVVIDSFTQLTSSANGHAGRDLKDESKFEYDHWRMQYVYLEKVLDLCQNAEFNVVMITHELGIEQVDGQEKIVPAGGSKNFARNVAKYFGHIIYCSVRNKKHTASSMTTDQAKILTGSRLDVDLSAGQTLKDIFDKSASLSSKHKASTTSSNSDSKSSSTSTQGSSSNSSSSALDRLRSKK